MGRSGALVLIALLALAACKGGSEAEPVATDIPSAVTAGKAAGPVVESKYGTPVKDRVATLGLLNKRNNLSQDLVLRPGEARRVGNVVVRLASCEKTLPWERPAEIGAFVQVFVEERAGTTSPLSWHKVFSGWLFKNAPAVNVVEHPVYDVWVKDCAMKFPGEEEDPAAAAAASKAAKPSAIPTPTPSATPSPSPAPKPTPSPSLGV